MDEESLTERAEAHLRAGSIDSIQKEAAQAAPMRCLNKKAAPRGVPDAEILTDLAFPNADSSDGSIDQIDALMMGEEGPLAAAVVFYGGSADIHEEGALGGGIGAASAGMPAIDRRRGRLRQRKADISVSHCASPNRRRVTGRNRSC